MSQPRLLATQVPDRPRAVVLVLHGGGARPGRMMVSPTQLSVLRMVPVAHRVARTARRDLAVYRLLNSHRGWDTRHTPVDDVHWALEQVHLAHGGLPVGLVGHSLGGRAALLSAGAPGVGSVVALNPYLLPQDRLAAGGAPTLVVHGDRDRIADLDTVVAAARRLPAEAAFTHVTVSGAKHAMLRRGRTFERLAAQFTAATLLDHELPDAGAVDLASSGQRWRTL